MKYLGKIRDPKDLTTKEYVDNGVSGVQTSLTTHINDKTNPHKVTKTQVGLSNVDNIKQWSESNHPTTLGGYGITDGVNNTQLEDLSDRVDTNESDIESIQTEVGNIKTNYVPNTRTINGKALSNNITLNANDVSALSSDITYVSSVDGSSGAVTTNAVKYVEQTLTEAQKTQVRTNIGAGTSSFSGDYEDLSNKPNIPAKTSDLTNDSGFITQSDIAVKSVNGKTGAVELNASDVGALPSTTKIPTKTSDLDNDSGFITSAPVTSVNSKTGAVTLGAGDVGALPTTGGTLTGNLKVGSASLGTNGYVVGTWLQGTAANHMNYAAPKIAVQDSSGWIYHRTASEIKSDIGAGNTDTYKISSPTVARSAWVANTNSQAVAQEKTDYPFMATISITTPAITTNDIARVMFGYTEQASGNFSPNCYTTTNGVIIEAKKKPSATITLDYILIERIL